MNYDITFCDNQKCKNLECKRNQNNIPKTEYKLKQIWQGRFTTCEFYAKESE